MINFVPIVQGFADVVKNREKLCGAGEAGPEAMLERVEPFRAEVKFLRAPHFFKTLESTDKRDM